MNEISTTANETSSARDRDRLATSLLALIAFAAVLIAWQTVGLSGLLYPFRLFVSLIHELGHGTAALISGGRFLKFEVFDNGAGLATTAGGNPLLILPAGYLGAAGFGAVLLVLTNRLRSVRVVAVVTAALVTLCVVLFSGTQVGLFVALLVGAVGAFLVGDHFRRYHLPAFGVAIVLAVLLIMLVGSITALRVGIGMAVVLALIGLLAPRLLVTFVLNFIAFIVGLNAVLDIWFLFNNLGAGVGAVRNDAAALAAVTNVPAAFWAGAWGLLAAAMMLIAAYIAFIQPLRRQRA
jgi:hypothetical protein